VSSAPDLDVVITGTAPRRAPRVLPQRESLPIDLEAQAVVIDRLVRRHEDTRARLDAAGVTLRPSEFAGDMHPEIVRAIIEAEQKGITVSESTICRIVSAHLEDPRATLDELARIVTLTAATMEVSKAARLVSDLASQRRLLAKAQGWAAELRGAVDLSTFVERAREALDDAQAVTPSGPGPEQDDPLRGLADLGKVALVGRARIVAQSLEPVPYVWDDIAVAATINMLAGGPAEGKTTLLFLVLVARMHAGEPIELLGRTVHPAPAGKWIVLIEGEHGEGSTCRKLVRSCELLGVDLEALDRIVIVARKSVRVGSPEWADVTRMVAAGIVSDIALDTIARVAPADANSESEQVAIFDLVARTIEAAPTEADKPTVWAVAHTRKNGTGGLEDVAGSAQRTGQADTVLLVVGEKEGGRTVASTVTFAKLREEPDDYPEPVTFAIVKQADGSRDLVTGADSATHDAPIEERILALLAAGPKTKTNLADKLKCRKTVVEAAITNLFSTRQIQSAEVTFNGRPYKAFGLRSDARLTPDGTPDGARRRTTPDDAGRWEGD
jgi:hypothetical protein